MQEFLAGGVLPLWVIALIVVWTIPWKGVAMWKAARLSHKKWFILLLIINTLGILEIIYIYFVARKAELAAASEDSVE